jgi:hypothetical protein
LRAKFREPLTFLSNLRFDGAVWSWGITVELATGFTGDDPGGFKVAGDVEVNGAVAAKDGTGGFLGTPTPNLVAPFKPWNSDIPLETTVCGALTVDCTGASLTSSICK